ncbi:photosynthetic complex assembly protein PuhC [Beijerinckia sp. L45]|uniref:photosynthetic complex assembly protein PuhC n=1 Tax=Beijerinckia sp. L45 TaxID=1641855 RepID=UPI00131E7E2A|nr:photosynthetic complex assembly protein PuhC [Beijerinckia sp. L45]
MRYTMESNIVPRAMVVGLAGVLVLTMAIASVSRLTGAYVVTMPPTHAIASRDLRFEDRADRGIDVRDATTGALIATVPPKTGGFLRGAMRGLLYDFRYGLHRSDEAPDYPFHLTRWADGRLSLEDSKTHRTLELEAFGSTNEQVFADFLERAPR